MRIGNAPERKLQRHAIYSCSKVFLCQQTMKWGNWDQMSLIVMRFSSIAKWLFVCTITVFTVAILACSQRLLGCRKWKEGQRFSQTSLIWSQLSLSGRKWIKLIRRSKKSLSSQTGAAAALYKHLELENPTCQVSSPLSPSAIISRCVLSRPSNTTRGPASLPAIWLQYVLNITGYTLPASAHSLRIPFSC